MKDPHNNPNKYIEIGYCIRIELAINWVWYELHEVVGVRVLETLHQNAIKIYHSRTIV